MDPWAELDAWCKTQAERVSDEAWAMLANGASLNDPQYRVKLGESGAYHRMRSYISGARRQVA